MKNSNVSKSQIVSVGITNQRETTVAWDRETGKPIQNAIVWLDKRNANTVKTVLTEAGGDMFKYSHKTGLPISSYFSALKMKWLLSDENPSVADIKMALKSRRL